MRTTTKRIVCLLLMAGFMILSVCACGQEKEELSKRKTEAEKVEEAVKTVEAPENQEKEEESWINHYYNRGIYFKDGYTYRQFADGLYRRGTGSDEWELLFENPMNYGRGLPVLETGCILPDIRRRLMCRAAAGTIRCFIMTWIQGNRERC